MGLENIKQNIVELALAYGFIEIKPQKNPYMLSFKKEEDGDARVNYYFTTGTVQVQYKKEMSPQIIKKNITLLDFENLLLSI